MRSHRALAALLALSVACGATEAERAATTEAHERPGEPPATATPPPPAHADPEPCAGRHEVVVEAPPTELACDDGFAACTGTHRLVVHHCASTPITVLRAELTSPDGARTIRELAPVALSPSGTLEIAVPAGGDAATLEGRVVFARDGTEQHAAFTISQRAPDLDAARRACDACGGTFGRFGLLSQLRCNCPTRDAGRACRRRSECEGACLFERYERVAQPDGSELAHPIGRCDDVQLRSGCHAQIDDDAAPVPTRPGLALRAPVVCVD